MALTPGARLGVYEIIAGIGVGGMGEVYRATDTTLGRQVAIKILPQAFASDPERLVRFEREAKTLASLNHPNIAQIYGLEKSDGIRALVMELVEGPTLADRIAQGPIPVDEALPLAKQIAEALEAAHEQGVIHRDLKPANIKVRPDGTVKVLDFGLAKALEPVVGATSHGVIESPTLSVRATQLGTILGTAAYMAPEQARGKPVDTRADIWAFGVVLYEMLTGRRAFAGENVTDILAKVIERDPDWTLLPAGTPPAIRRLLARCLSKNQKQRLRDIGDARLELEEMRHEPPGGGPAHGQTPYRKHPVVWLLAALIASAISMAAFLWTTRSDRTLPRFVSNIVPPEGTAFITSTPMALSPDGGMVAFVARQPGRSTLIWVRSLDTGAVRAIPGSDNGEQPFWSPDSRFLGYFANQKLWKVDVRADGTPSVIADAAASGGATWGLDDTILFGAVGQGALTRIRASGGTPASVLEPDTGLWLVYPSFLPDSRHFLFSVLSLREEEEEGVFVGSLGSTERRRLLPFFTRAVYVPPGMLLYMRERTLWAHKFSLQTLSVEGEPSRVADGIQTALLGAAMFSASTNGVLMYQTGEATGSTELAWVDRAGREVAPPLAPPGEYFNLRLSHDGQRLAIDVTDSLRPNGDIWIFEPARRVSSRLTYDPVDESCPVWSVDDSELFFVRNPNLYRIAVSGKGVARLIFESPPEKCPNDWSRDGRYLLFSSFERGAPPDLGS